MSEKNNAVEENIILATIECIEKFGISGATNRQIAQAAGVNLAAINYYFRSKEVLIRRCMERTLNNAFDLSDIPRMPDSSPQERCIQILMHLTLGGFQYPGITRAHFYNLMAEGRYDALLVEHVNRFIDNLAGDLQSRGCGLAPEDLRIALRQLMSAVIFTILAPELFEKTPGIDLHNPDTCRAYITRLVNKLLG